MIKKNNETDNKISSFKKFSDMTSGNKTKEPKDNPELTEKPFNDEDIPMNPNLPLNKSKQEKPASTKYLKPEQEETELTNEEVQFFGKVAKLPKGVKASKGFNFLENVKVSKSSIWYIMVEKQDNELQMVKYNYKKGVDLGSFLNELKSFYVAKFSKNPKMCKLIENIKIDGNDKYSWIKNIPLVEFEGKKMISKITEDLIKLLSK